MGKLAIQPHDFEKAKEEIKKFSEETTTDLDLKRVDDSKGGFEFFSDLFLGRGLGIDHIVKGEEFNELTSQIQTHLHSINNTQIKLIKEFEQVYKALEALDKGYIQAILISIKATEEKSEGIKKNQEQITKIVENQRKTLKELYKFKQKLDGCAHLDDIDKIWSNCQKWHQDMVSFTKEISASTEHSKDNSQKIEALKIALSTAEKKTGDLSAQVSWMIERLESITTFTSALAKIKHLQDVDSTWNIVKEHSEKLTEIDRQNETIAASIQKNKEDVEAQIIESNNVITALTQKMKYTYWIAGGAAGMAIIELILLLL